VLQLAAYEELRLLQTLRDNRRHHTKPPVHPQLSDFTLVGQGTHGIKKNLTVSIYSKYSWALHA